MSLTKPTTVPEWARTTAWISVPTEGAKDLGFAYEAAPASNIENWRTKLVGEWFGWINERFSDGPIVVTDFRIKHPGTGNTAIDVKENSVIIYANGNSAVSFGTTEIAWKLSTTGDTLLKLEARKLYLFPEGAAGADNGAAYYLENPSRSSHAAKTWSLAQFQSKLILRSWSSAAALEHAYWTISHHATEPKMIFADAMYVIPTTNSNGFIGADAIRWNSVFANKVYETDAPYLWASQQAGGLTTPAGAWTIITPTANILSAGLSVEETAGRIEAVSGAEGWYKVDCVLLADPANANMDLSIAIYRNGTKIPVSQQDFYLNSTTNVQQVSYSFIARLDVATDYIQLYGYHAALGTINILNGSQLSAVQCRRIKV